MNKNIRHNIGDKVVSLTNQSSSLSQPRIKGHIYNVYSIKYCPTCGTQMINIGYKTNLLYVSCSDCKHTQENDGLHWTISPLFAKVDDLENTLNECVENEDYEFASILRDILKETQHI